VNKPKFYKSFRSRKHQDSLSNLQVLTTDILKDHKKIIIDIGFGTGESTIYLHNKYKDCLVCGLEAYKLGINKLVDKSIMTHYGDALEFLEKIDSNTINKVYMLFPDPWQKKKHRKRRLFNEYTFSVIDRILLKRGMFHFASDNIDYAIRAKRIMQAACKESNGFSKNRGERPITKYEKKALSKNKFVFDLIYTKN